MAKNALSHWGWGYADKAPSDSDRDTMAQRIGAMLGGIQFSRLPLPALDAVELPAPRMAVPEALADFCADAPADRATHTYGKGYCDLVRGLAGDFAVAPDFVAYPRNDDEINAVLAWCSAAQVACTPFGGGTSVVGGVECAIGDRFAGSVSLDMRQLNRVIEIDPLSRAARIQAGATGPVVAAQLAPHGFSLRHYPQSFEFSTLGGWIATRAGGHFATLYTHIDDLVESVRMLTPQGVWESLRLPGSGAGPSPDRLALGSEGIFGVITDAWMRIHARPRWRSNASVKFRDFAAAIEAVRTIAQAGLYPANCRLLDAREALLHHVTDDGTCVLLLGFESADHPMTASMARALEIAQSCGGTSSGAVASDSGPVDNSRDKDAHGGRAGEAGSWRQAFFEAPYRLNTLVSIGAVVDTFETSCTWDAFEALHSAIIKAVSTAMREVCGGGMMSCRFTHVYPDGPAPYYTFVAPGHPDGKPESRLAQWADIKAAASEALANHGATITHHHAVGRTHRPWYDRQRPAPFAMALRAAKAALDPAGVLNPGVLVD